MQKHLYHPQLEKLIRTSLDEICKDMAQYLPRMSLKASKWMDCISKKGKMAERFLTQEQFPMLLLPWWLNQQLSKDVNDPFFRGLIKAVINGYYCIRLIDNMMDQEQKGERAILSASTYFQSRFQRFFQEWFSSDHPFWGDYHHYWFASADLAHEDLQLKHINEEVFKTISGQKTCAAHIPLIALCYHHNQLSALNSWTLLCKQFGYYHQFLDDFLDYHDDLSRGQNTYFLTHAKQVKSEQEGFTVWLLREGFTWASEKLDAFMSDLLQTASSINYPDLNAYLEIRQEEQRNRVKIFGTGQKELRKIQTIFKG